jgi:hypothetical protein
VCLLLSAFFWILHALSKEYILTIRVPLAYSHLPDQGLVAVEMPDSIDVEVSGSGFTIFAYRWTNAAGPLELDVRKARPLGGGDYALATYTRGRLEGTVGHGLRMLRAMPDSIILSFAGRVEKQVPVRPKVSVTCAPMFRLGDSVRTEPAFVTISGAESLVKRISFIETEPKVYNDLDQSVNEPVRLVLPGDVTQVAVKPAEVNLIVPVGKYTEKKMSVPVESINVPPNVVLKTFPDKVDVLFQVPVENYESIRPEMFRVIVDYSKVEAGSNTMPVEIIRQPLNIRNLRLEPLRVEYIIRK